MENATYLLVSGGTGSQLSAVTPASSASTPTTAMSNGGQLASSGSAANSFVTLGPGKSVLNIRGVTSQFVTNWKANDVAGTIRQGSPQMRLVVANQKDSPSATANFATVTNLGFSPRFSGTLGNSTGIKVEVTSSSAYGAVQKIAPATVLSFASVSKNSVVRQSNAASGTKVSIRPHGTLVMDPKLCASPVWNTGGVASIEPKFVSSLNTNSPSKVVIQLNPEQLSMLTGAVPQSATIGGKLRASTPNQPVANNTATAQFVRLVAAAQQPIQPKIMPSVQLVSSISNSVCVSSAKAKSSSTLQISRGGIATVTSQPSTTQRLILPATPQMRQSIATPGFYTIGGVTQVTNCTPAAAIISQATFVGQPTFTYQSSSKASSTLSRTRSLEGAGSCDFNDSVSQQQHQQHRVNSWTPEPPAPASRPRKPCNCTKSQCLKLYCECFANGEFCYDCNCCNCFNNLQHEDERTKAVKQCLERNPHAFHPKIGKGGNVRQHCKGCNCKRSGCLKNYCECYEAKIPCSNLCRCVGCKNFEENPDRQSLLHLADAAEVRVQQQAAAETKLAGQIIGPPVRPQLPPAGAERPAYTFITLDVIEAMCLCLIAETEEGEQNGRSDVAQERRIITEFGRCLTQVIDSASRTRAPTPFEQQ